MLEENKNKNCPHPLNMLAPLYLLLAMVLKFHVLFENKATFQRHFLCML
jgi:hypothetical protein